jgi:hypothetical protein
MSKRSKKRRERKMKKLEQQRVAAEHSPSAENKPDDHPAQKVLVASNSQAQKPAQKPDGDKKPTPEPRKGRFVRFWQWIRGPFRDANRVMAYATVILAAIGVAGLWLTRSTLQQNDELFRGSQRAYVTIGRKDGVVAEFVRPKDPKVRLASEFDCQPWMHQPPSNPDVVYLPACKTLKEQQQESKNAAEPAKSK